MKITRKFSEFANSVLNYKISKKRLLIILGAVLIVLFVALFFKNIPRYINLLEYDNFLQSNSIQSAEISGDKVLLKVLNKNYYVLKDTINLAELGQKIPIKVADTSFSDIAIWLVLLAFALILYLNSHAKYSQSSQIAQSKDVSQIINAVTPVISNVAFRDVAGIEEVKVELMEIVDFLKNPSKYKDFGITMPRGVLMVGPPGVGKTLVAKAVAGEAGVPFFYQSGASFVQIYVGMGAKRVRELFSKAKAYAPSIIFIDEIDAVGRARGGGRNDEREATLNQLLTEMDGFTDNNGVIVIAATNKIELIDDALLRSGRFDRRVFLGLPDFRDRTLILQTYLRGKEYNADIDAIARDTTGFSGAGLATLVNEAAINALRENREIITDIDFKAVANKVLYGKRKIHSLNSQEKEIQAIYKAAKAICADWFGVEFDKISLLEDRFLVSEKFLESKTSLLSRIKVALCGSIALKIYKDESYTNAKNDVADARELARELVVDYAMNDNLLGSNADIKEVLDICQRQTEEFLRSVAPQIAIVKKYLIENESVSRAQIRELVRNSYE